MFIESIIQKIKTAPKTSGVYIFYKGVKPLYVGKAINLKNRLAYYLKENTDSKNAFLQKESDRLVLRRLSSGIKALIVESRLIKKLRPSYNILMADDKSYFYIFISKDKFPKIFIGHSIGNWKLKIKNFERIGSFTDGQSLRIVLKSLRRIFPYCVCKVPHRRVCLNSQIGNCPGFCCRLDSEPSRAEILKYQKNITAIKNFFLGKKDIKELEKSLGLKDKLAAFENVISHRGLVSASETGTENKNGFLKAECYDISHLSGREAVGAMTAWIKKNGVWQAEKFLWRKFKIRTLPAGRQARGLDDPRAIAEVISRRFKHPEWPFPDLVIIDGGLTQLNAAQKVITSLKAKSYQALHTGRQVKAIQVISFAKPHKLVYGLLSEPLKIEKVSLDLAKIVQKAIYYTHNFAVRYHRQLRNHKIV